MTERGPVVNSPALNSTTTRTSVAPNRKQQLLLMGLPPDASRYDLSTFDTEKDMSANTNKTNNLPANPNMKSDLPGSINMTNNLPASNKTTGLGPHDNFEFDFNPVPFSDTPLDVDMYGNLSERVPLWKPPHPQEPLLLKGNTPFNPNNHLPTINKQVREALAHPHNPIYARVPGVAGLTPQQIHERQKVQAYFWQVFCAGELHKLGLARADFVIGRKLLIRFETGEDGPEILTGWDATWKPSPGSLAYGWAFVDRNGVVVDTDDDRLVDVQALFEHSLSSFHGDYERLIAADHCPEVKVPLHLIDSRLLSGF
ncbi:hypothetical protein SCAR479_11391 [Seiridium cardinale]|uniref:Uncharacterized protein n=1 Tax=Seiridium cardinale TaxID=138064 RepID=A0ABR2XE00_9PEZI